MYKASESNTEKLESLIRSIGIGMLTTEDENGCMRSRPMATLDSPLSEDNSLWFFSRSDSGSIHDGEWVNVSYSDPATNSYVSVSGIIRLVRDKRRSEELWKPIHRAWFPDGVNDPSLVLLQVHIQQAEYWDSPHSKVGEFFGMAKAIAKGEVYSPGAHERVNL